MKHNLDRFLPSSLKEIPKRLTHLFKKPELRYMETHLTDHCNLNCKGCGHYSPLAEPFFTEIDQHTADMKRLRQLFSNICKIRLMGGEPLLHPDPGAFVTVTREAFPRAEIHFVTNGILLPRASAEFWEVLRETKTTIDLAIYPPVKKEEELRALCKSEEVPVALMRVDTFHAHRNLRGDSDVKKAFDLCRGKYFCPLLKQGRLHTCGMPAYIHYFNEAFDYDIAADEGVDIYQRGLTGSKIIKQLYEPIETCRWCTYDFVPYPWAISSQSPTDWDAEEHRKEAAREKETGEREHPHA